MTVHVTYKDLYLGNNSRTSNPVSLAVRRRLQELNFPVDRYLVYVAQRITLIPLSDNRRQIDQAAPVLKYSMPPQVKSRLIHYYTSLKNPEKGLKITPFWFNSYLIREPLLVSPVL